jgi:hypothetical protein
MRTIPGTAPSHRRTGPFAAVLLFVAFAGAAPARAQNPDLVREIQEIATRIDQQLQEIDRLLLDSGKKAQPREKPKDMLKTSHERSADVEAGIDALIQKLTEMKNQGSSSQSQSGDQQQQDQQQQDQDQQGKQQQNKGQRGQQPRRENQTPNFVQQPPRDQQGQQQGQQQNQPQGQQQQPGEQPQGEQPGQQPPPGQGNPLGGQDHQGPGENRTGNRQPEPDLGPGQAGQGEGSWGDLPPYVNFLKNRGSAPTTVPAKYRKYWEAYLKSKPGGAAGNGGK